MSARSHRRRRERPATATAVPQPGDAAASSRRQGLLWGLAGALAILPLLWSSRSPVLGAPVADDYLFLAQLQRKAMPDLFGPMGAAWYWRPVSRQLYYLLLGPRLPDAPWLGALAAALLLLALYALLYRIARHRFAPAPAAALATFPLLAEPARVLLAWPSAAQHLLGAVFAALAVERALGSPRRARLGLVAGGAAALLALLSNEAAVVVLPALPLIAWFRTRSRTGPAGAGTPGRWGAVALAVAALWAAGYAVARTHGSALPAGNRMGASPLGLVAVIAQALISQLGYEGLAPALREPLLAFAAALVAAGLIMSLRAAARARIARAAPALLGGLAWFVAAVAPLALLLPDWNAWRTTVASLGLAVALGGWLALAWRPLVVALVALRLTTLLLAQPAPAVVATAPPPGASSFSFARITRLQRIVESTRRTLRAEVPRLPHHAVVRFGELPWLAEVGFNGANALHVWYRDTTLTWRGLGGYEGVRGRTDAFVEYEPDDPWPAVHIEAKAFQLYREAYAAALIGHLVSADSLLVAARRAQRHDAVKFFGLVDTARSIIARTRPPVGLGRIRMRDSTR
jgi:hypothetical protein